MKVWIIEYERFGEHIFYEVAASKEAAERFIDRCIQEDVRGSKVENDISFRRVLRSRFHVNEATVYE